MAGYVIYQRQAEIKSTAEEDHTGQKTTSEQNRNKTKMQNSKCAGGMEIDVKGNVKQFVTKVEHVAERIMVMHIKTQIQGKATIVLNRHPPDTRNEERILGPH